MCTATRRRAQPPRLSICAFSINSTGSAWWTTSSTACRSWGQRAAYAQQAIREKVLDHNSYIARYGDDMPEVRDWQWGALRAAKGGKADTAADNV